MPIFQAMLIGSTIILLSSTRLQVWFTTQNNWLTISNTRRSIRLSIWTMQCFSSLSSSKDCSYSKSPKR